MPLKITLKPGERFVINGAVIENGDHRASMTIINRTSVLREKDIMQEADANTPTKRIYFPVMMMYLDPENTQKYYEEFVVRMTEFMGVIKNPDVLAECVAVNRDLMSGENYKALVKIRRLMDYENERLKNVGSSVSDGRVAC
jgi:flagellar protein FlbT